MSLIDDFAQLENLIFFILLTNFSFKNPFLNISLDDIVVFLLDKGLKGPVTDGPHGVVWDSRDKDGGKLILSGLDSQTLVVLRAGENLRHRMLTLKTIKLF